MKRVGDEYDTELILDEENNVLIGSKFYSGKEQQNAAFTWEVLKKMSHEMSFIPTILDYQIKGSAVEYAIAPIDGMYPLEYYCRDLHLNPSVENFKKILFIKNTLLHTWNSAIENFGIANDLYVERSSYWHSTVISSSNVLYLLNFYDFSPIKIDEDTMSTNVFKVTDNTDLNNILQHSNNYFYYSRLKKELEEIRKTNKRDLQSLKRKTEELLNKKNEQLKNSIGKDTIIANMGKAQYNFYFGDSDG